MKPVAIYFDLLKYQPANRELLEQQFEVLCFPAPPACTAEALARATVVFAPLGYRYDDAFFARCPQLKVIASNTTGIPHIDAGAAARRHIAVCALHDEQVFLDTITPTAEHTIGLMIAALRRLPAAHRSAVDGGVWDRRPWGAPRMLSRLQLGLVGYGRLGRKVAATARAMGMRVQYYDPLVPGGMTDLLQMATASDVLSLHAPATPATRHLVDRRILQALPKHAVVINTARGELLDTDALLDLLETGHLWAAALDTIDGEYAEDFAAVYAASRILAYARSHDNLILTPHIGGSTVDAWFETERRVIVKACRALGLAVEGTRP